jgi:DNA excision repair protein ERCC-2
MSRAKPKIFPYEPRENQKIVMEHISKILGEKTHLIVESGTGSGKTICALAPTLEFALKKKKKVVYLTRTNSQQKQVIMELRSINKKKKVFGLGIQGRQHMCPLLDDRSELENGTAEELSKLCGDLKKATLDGAEGCPYYSRLLGCDIEKIKKLARNRLPTVEEFITLCAENGRICPYEANKALLRDATVVTAPYVFFFYTVIRRALLDWLGVHVSDLIVIVDEAHNLADYARELFSEDLSVRALELARLEAKDIGDPILCRELRISSLCDALAKMIKDVAKEYVIEEDGLVPSDEISVWLMSRFGMTSREIQVMIADMVTHGDIIRERKRRSGKLPRSHIYKTGRFVQNWMLLEDSEYAKLVLGGENPMLEAYCLSPEKATGILNESHSSVHMSGTLAPLAEYRDSIGLPKETECIILPSPFPKENRVILYTDEFTTRFETLASDDQMIPRMKDFLLDVTKRFQRNTILFFPSFSLLAKFSDLAPKFGRECFFEEQGMTQDELMTTVQNFKLERGAIMFSVMGGRISEGIDFPDRELEIAILIGIPFPKPTAKQKSLLNYYDVKFGTGWEYTVKAPAVRKMLQSIGRLLRRETDRGAALILDSRTTQLKTEMPDATLSENVVSEMSDFFASG